MNVRNVIASALESSGINLVGTATADQYDARAPAGRKARDLHPGATGLVVVGSGGLPLFVAFRSACAEDASLLGKDHPLDTFVRRALERADAALLASGMGSRRFEPAVYAEPRLNFLALGEIVGLGSPGPFGMLIHPDFGPWWGLRGAYFVEGEVESAPIRSPVCENCTRPCVKGSTSEGKRFALATFETRKKCILGTSERYSDEQIRYHEERLAMAMAKGGCAPPNR